MRPPANRPAREIRITGIPNQPIIIATKLDKLKRSQVQKHVKMIKTGLNVKKGTVVIPFSATTKQGREEIWQTICSLNEETEETEEA